MLIFLVIVLDTPLDAIGENTELFLFSIPTSLPLNLICVCIIAIQIQAVFRNFHDPHKCTDKICAVNWIFSDNSLKGICKINKKLIIKYRA